METEEKTMSIEEELAEMGTIEQAMHETRKQLEKHYFVSWVAFGGDPGFLVRATLEPPLGSSVSGVRIRIEGSGRDAKAALEDLFSQNGWPDSFIPARK